QEHIVHRARPARRPLQIAPGFSQGTGQILDAPPAAVDRLPAQGRDADRPADEDRRRDGWADAGARHPALKRAPAGASSERRASDPALRRTLVLETIGGL